MISYFGAIWNCRHFWLSLVKLDLRTRYRRSVLGLGWSLLQPICMTAIYCVVFHKLFHVSIAEYAPHVLAGQVIWGLIQISTLQGCQSFFQGEAYIRQCPMPLAVFPLRTVLAASFHFLVAMAVVIALVTGLGLAGMRETHYLAMLNLVPAIALLFFFCWSMAIIAGISNVYFQDTQHLAEVGFQMLFFCTPIIYYADRLESVGLGWLMHLNPVVVFLKLIREPVLTGHAPSLFTYLQGFGIVAAAMGLAAYLLARHQKRLIFQL
jgi:ABC-type polysaccharide/polyol phosphate export permease